MSRAQAIETRLEKLVPSLEEYFTSGFLTREETHDVARNRTHWEYRLVAKPLLLLDVQNAVAYELGLEKRLQEYCRTTRLVLKHRWAVLERIESIYRIGIKHLKNREELELIRKEFICFLKEYRRHSTLSAFYAELMVRYPTRTSLWVEAALYEGIEAGNTDNGRAIVQQAILTSAAEPEVWNAAFLLELYFADRLLLGLVEAESQKDQQSDKQEKHDIVQALRAENAALANVVVDLALAKAVVEEAFQSPACGPKLAQLLLDSAMRFSYSRPLVELLMESAALSLGSAVAATLSDGSGKAFLHTWNEVAVSWFLRDYLTLEVVMIDRGITGDAASYLRSGGRMHAATAVERSAALLKGLSAALTLAQVEIEAAPSFARQLQKSAVAVVETLFETLQQSSSVSDAISSLCRQLILGQPVSAAEAVRCLHRRDDKSLVRQLADAPVERVYAFLQGIRSAIVRTKKAKHEDSGTDNKMWRLCRFLTSKDRKAVEVTVPLRAAASCVTVDDVERLIFSQRDASDGVAVDRAVRMFLDKFHFLRYGEALEGIKKLRYNETKTPIFFWRVFHLLESHCGAKKAYTSSRTLEVDGANDRCSEDGSKDSDNDDDKKCNGATGESRVGDESYAAAGLRFLASVPRESLVCSAEEERLDGCWYLLLARIQTLAALGEGSTTRSGFIDRLQRLGSDDWVEGVRSVLSVARLCEPLPRRVLAEIAIPFFEAVALERGGGSALREAREAHERLLGMYSLSKHPSSFLPLVHHVPRGPEGKSARLSPCELNAIDWAQLVAFERTVAKDLRRAKETATRAKRIALDPQRLLAILSAY